MLEDGASLAKLHIIILCHPAVWLILYPAAKIIEAKFVERMPTIPSWLNERGVAMEIDFSQVLQEAPLPGIRVSRRIPCR